MLSPTETDSSWWLGAISHADRLTPEVPTRDGMMSPSSQRAVPRCVSKINTWFM